MYKNNLIQNEQNTFVNFIIVLSVILISKSLYYETYGENIFYLPLFVFLSYLSYVRKIKFHKWIILYSLFFISLVMINLESQYSSIMILLFRLSIGLMLISLIEFERFSKIFSSIILFIGLISLLSIPVIYFNISSPLSDFVATDSRRLRNFIFFGVTENFITLSTYKNSGLWWEPGAFALFVNLAVIFSIINKDMTLKKFILFGIIIFSTGSTTGLIVFLLLSLTMINSKIHKKNILIILFVLPILLFVVYTFFLPIIMEKFDPEGNSIASFLSRYYDVVISLEMLKENILLGYGFGSYTVNAIPFGKNIFGQFLYYSPAKPTGADGITLLLAQTGILSIILLLPFLFPKYFRDLTLLQKLIITLSLFITFNTENFTFTLIFIALTFYGLVGNYKHGKKERYDTIGN